MHPLPTLLLQLSIIVAAAVLLGAAVRRLGQPAVIGEMAAGILLGPSVLGFAWPEAKDFLFPSHSLPNLSLLSQVGVLLFMFAVGMELDLTSVRRHARTAVFVSQAGILVPFLLGIAMVLARPSLAPGGAPTLAFVLFMGVAMSITAFPVLARILEERGLMRTPLGATAMASAAVDDVTAWTLLAFLIAVARSQSLLDGVWTACLAALYAAAMLWLVRPALGRWYSRLAQGGKADAEPGVEADPGKAVAAVLLIGVFLSALATEAIGVHALFGAFLAGVIIPRRGRLRVFLKERIEYAASLYLLPVFFAFTGLRTEIRLLSGWQDWGMAAALLSVAVAGKLGGVCLAARLAGRPWRESLALGSLMNTRGLMELIVLNIGLDLGILPPRIFAMMVIMALVTTAMTGPLLKLLKIDGGALGGEGADSAKDRLQNGPLVA